MEKAPSPARPTAALLAAGLFVLVAILSGPGRVIDVVAVLTMGVFVFGMGVATLRLTVALLGMALFLVFAGTLAQVDQGIWTVIRQYFRCPVAWIEIKIFFFPRNWKVPGQLPFPGGWLLGGALLVNLIVSHASRIRVQARGLRLALGGVVLTLGGILTWFVISRVFASDTSGATAAPFWRVTLQLLHGTAAALALFLGCRLLFARKAGIVLLHAGIVLLMGHEIVTGLFATEAVMRISEGQTVRHVEDTRHVELAIVEGSHPEFDDVVVVSEKQLQQGEKIRHPELPFDVEPAGSYLKNADLRPLRSGEKNPATAGIGEQWRAHPRKESGGLGSNARIDTPAVYLTFREKASGESLGTYLVALEWTKPQVVNAGDKKYEVSLRFRRTYKPYSLYLYDFRFDRYPGTNVPKDFSSFVRLTDRERGVTRDVRIWMNNPLRYRGDTLYQADWDKENEAGTVLQVVDNESWMVPYAACMIVAVGMLGQFVLHLVGFLKRRAAE